MDQEEHVKQPRSIKEHLTTCCSTRADRRSLYSLHLKTGSNQAVPLPSPHLLVEIIRTAKKHSPPQPWGGGQVLLLTHAHVHTNTHTHTHVPHYTKISRWFMGFQVLLREVCNISQFRTCYFCWQAKQLWKKGTEERKAGREGKQRGRRSKLSLTDVDLDCTPNKKVLG